MVNKIYAVLICERCVLDPNLVNLPRLLGGHLHSDSPRQCLMFLPTLRLDRPDPVRPGGEFVGISVHR